MSLYLIFNDELKGFYKSKAMAALWILFIIFTIVGYFGQKVLGKGLLPGTSIASLLISTYGGIITSIVITVSIIHEKDQKVYDLFMIRPVKRWYFLVAKFFAVYICVIVGVIISLSIGVLIDYFELGMILPGVSDSLITTASIMAVACGFGIFMGVLSPSILVAVLISIFFGQVVNLLPMIISSFIDFENMLLLTSTLAIIIALSLMAVSIYVFEKKQF
jgi:ABC-type transport system involved in multi-copper enzyme maturation permease subunit